MTRRAPVRFTRRRLLASLVAAACGWAVLPLTGSLRALMPLSRGGPAERPLAAADLYAPHDLAG